MQSYNIKDYSVEFDRTATVDWYEKYEGWGCDCGDCQSFLAWVRQKQLPPAVIELLQIFGALPEKPTYVCETAVELLESQPPHSKSQYIANALAYYNANFADDPQPVKVAPPVIDRTTIEAIVRELMRQETQHSDVSSDKRVGSKTEPVLPSIKQPAPDYELQQREKLEIDDATRDMIFSTMEAFRKG